MTQKHVVKREGGCRTVRQVADSQCGRCTSMFVKKDQICQATRVGTLDKVRQDQRTPIQTNRSGQQETNLFGEGPKTSGR